MKRLQLPQNGGSIVFGTVDFWILALDFQVSNFRIFCIGFFYFYTLYAILDYLDRIGSNLNFRTIQIGFNFYKILNFHIESNWDKKNLLCNVTWISIIRFIYWRGIIFFIVHFIFKTLIRNTWFCNYKTMSQWLKRRKRRLGHVKLITLTNFD